MVDKSIHRSDFKEALVNSGLMFVYMIIFSVLGFVFMFLQGISDWIQLIIGLCFSVPILMIYFYQGTQEGTREFKKLNGNRLTDVNNMGTVTPNIFKGLLYALPYLLTSLIFAGLAWITNWQWLKFIVLVIFMPPAILGQAFGLITFPKEVTVNPGTVDEVTQMVGWTSGPMCFVVVAVFSVIAVLAFWIAYIRKIHQNKDQFISFVTEISENNKFKNQ